LAVFILRLTVPKDPPVVSEPDTQGKEVVQVGNNRCDISRYLEILRGKIPPCAYRIVPKRFRPAGIAPKTYFPNTLTSSMRDSAAAKIESCADAGFLEALPAQTSKHFF
jgi:hypothetical protein